MSILTALLVVLAIWLISATAICVSAIILGARMERWSQQATGEEGP